MAHCKLVAATKSVVGMTRVDRKDRSLNIKAISSRCASFARDARKSGARVLRKEWCIGCSNTLASQRL